VSEQTFTITLTVAEDEDRLSEGRLTDAAISAIDDAIEGAFPVSAEDADGRERSIRLADWGFI
jgi:hypothetical protein